MKKNVKIGAVVGKLAITIISLWVGGVIIQQLGAVMLNTCSPFYKALSFIGWTVTNRTGLAVGATCYNDPNTITSVTGDGILAVVGIVGLASVVMEFVSFRLG